jgi:hypothetical protein
MYSLYVYFLFQKNWGVSERGKKTQNLEPKFRNLVYLFSLLLALALALDRNHPS